REFGKRVTFTNDTSAPRTIRSGWCGSFLRQKLAGGCPRPAVSKSAATFPHALDPFLNQFLNRLEPRFSPNGAILPLLNFCLKLVDPVFGGLPSQFLRRKSEYRFDRIDRVLSITTERLCINLRRAMDRAGLPRRRSDARRSACAAEAQFEVPNLREHALDPIPQFVVHCVRQICRFGPAKLRKREILSIDKRPQGEAKERNLKQSWSRMCFWGLVPGRNRHCLHHIAHRQEGRLGQPASKCCICFRRLRIRVDDEQNQRFDGVAARLFEKTDLFHDPEKILECAVADIDDFCTVVLRN